MYTQKLLEHFLHPRHAGPMKDADGIGTIGDPGCGDYLRLYIKVTGDRLERVSFEVFGCPAAIATTSILAELVTGMTLEEALGVTDLDIVKSLGGLPEQKIHCSCLGTGALHRAVLDFMLRSAREGNNGQNGDPIKGKPCPDQ